MKKLMIVVVALAFCAGALAGCGSPCEKAFDKYASCMKDWGAKEDRIKRFKSKKEKWVGDCKKEGDKSKIKKCLDKSCKDYRKWIKNAD